ncbi:alkaline phosphatase [Rossellomorea vietnamensis]|uniref:alkaline phosphatase n=1 Tax=Rossellomorea vietnamensis TaxID=218284 RepID=UPI001E34DCF3|nr:alkaline phosphatase [Rossellomorea vietnamensis]MCC5803143.1 alkaline phosphatase [Rossellomorea vietnamensis]
MKTIKQLTILLSLLTLTLPASSTTAAPPPHKNVILMIMDGTNSDILTLSRWYRGTDLKLDTILRGGVRTYSAQSAITDSAAAGSAMATGVKTKADYIGMNPDRQPVLTVLEGAKLSGYRTGIVSTSPIQHATPAAFTSHVLNRDEFGDIGEQQVYQGLDVVLGGGGAWLKPQTKEPTKDDDGMLKTKQVSREDGENLFKEIHSAGYDLVLKRDGLLRGATSPKLWGVFADEDISYELDRSQLNPDEPSLSEMTHAAIDRLSKSEKGFFLMVEGSKVDWAAHKNDPVGMISEVLSFDDAVSEALDFARKDGNTMVVAVTDHGNSGLTLGNHGTNGDYKSMPADRFIKPLKKARLTVKGATSQLKKDRSNLKEVLLSYGLGELSKKEFDTMEAAKSVDDLENEMVKLMAKRANLGFTTHGHTGEDVFLYSYGPGKPVGLIENTDIPRVISDYMGFSLWTGPFATWYVNGMTYYRERGYEVSLEGRTSKNPVMVAKRDGEVLRFPENKDFYWRNDEKVGLKSVNVFDGETFYVHVED